MNSIGIRRGFFDSPPKDPPLLAVIGIARHSLRAYPKPMNILQLALIGPIGGPEMIMIFIVILLLFGAKKLPELARGVGKSMGEFKKAREEFEREITRSEDEVRRDERAKEASLKPAPGKESTEV